MKPHPRLRRRLLMVTTLLALLAGVWIYVSQRGWSLRAIVREQFARAWCAVDLYVLHRVPKFTGPKETIMLSTLLP